MLMLILIQKQPPAVFFRRRCSEKFCKIHGKTPVPEPFLNKVAGLRLLRTPFLQNTSGRLLLLIGIHLPLTVENEEQTLFQPAYLICFTVELLDNELKYLEKFFC